MSTATCSCFPSKIARAGIARRSRKACWRCSAPGDFGGAGAYAIQAEISACHATAATWADTEWSRILRLYDELLTSAPSPIVALNRAVAVCMHRGPAAGLEALSELEATLSNYHLFFSLRADFRSRSGQNARDDYQRALSLASNESERRFLRRKIDQLG